MTVRPIGIAHLTLLELQPPDLISVAAEAGFDFVGLRISPATPHESVYPMSPGSAMLRDTARRLEDLEITVADIEVLELRPTTTSETWLPVLESGATLGAKFLNVVPGDSEISRLGENYAKLIEDAKHFDIKPAIEPIPFRPLRTLSQALDLAETVKSSTILIDALHFYRSGADIDQLASAPPQLFQYAQICDAPIIAPSTTPPGLRPSRGQEADGPLQLEARASRLLPGEGELPLGSLISALPPMIPLSVEAPLVRSARFGDPSDVAYAAHAAAMKYRYI